MRVNQYAIGQIEDEKLKFAVMICTYQNKLVFVQHKLRSTLEFPGGHREQQELIQHCAKRELWEETGALNFVLTPQCIYGVKQEHEEESYGMLYTGEIFEFEDIPSVSEIKARFLSDTLPTHWTYPQIQPYLYEFIKK